MVNSKISDYVKWALNKGYTKKDIISELVRKGYDPRKFTKYLKDQKKADDNKTRVFQIIFLLAVMIFLVSGTYFGIFDKSDKIEKHISQGMDFYYQGDVSQAIDEFKKVVDLEPKSSVAHINLGYCYYSLGKRFNKKEYFDLSIEEFNKGIALNPENPKSYSGLGLVYLRLGDYDVAIQNLKKALELKPDSLDEYTPLGWAYISKKEYGLAYEYIKKAIESNQNDGLAHEGLGIIYYQEKKLDLAIEELKKSIGMRPPPSPATYTRLGIFYSERGEYELSLENLKIALELNPNSEIAKKEYDNVMSKLKLQQK